MLLTRFQADSSGEPSSLASRALRLVDRVQEVLVSGLSFGIERTFALARSHYENINLGVVSQGFARGYTEEQLDEIEAEVTPFARILADALEPEALSVILGEDSPPPEGS